MKKRLMTAGVLLVISVFAMIFSSTWYLPILMSIFSTIGTFEFLRCVGLDQKAIVSFPAYLIAFFMPIGAYCATDMQSFFVLCAAIVFLYMLYMFAVAVFMQGSMAFSEAALAYTGLCYIAISMASIVLLRMHTPVDKLTSIPIAGVAGAYLFVAPFLAAWGSDIFAFFIGVCIGKHKLCPKISPKKSVEGAIAGVLGGTLAILGLAVVIDIFTVFTVNYVMFLVFGVFASVVSQIGDLVASLLKREHGLKDYGKILPGHGGVMDRIDSVISVATLTLFFTLAQGSLALLTLPAPIV